MFMSAPQLHRMTGRVGEPSTLVIVIQPGEPAFITPPSVIFGISTVASSFLLPAVEAAASTGHLKSDLITVGELSHRPTVPAPAERRRSARSLDLPVVRRQRARLIGVDQLVLGLRDALEEIRTIVERLPDPFVRVSGIALEELSVDERLDERSDGRTSAAYPAHDER